MNLKQKEQYFQCLTRAEMGDIFEIQAFWNGGTYVGTPVGTTNTSFMVPVIRCQNYHSPTKQRSYKYPILQHTELYYSNQFAILETDQSVIRIIKKSKEIG
jgi:hypothetical protein